MIFRDKVLQQVSSVKAKAGPKQEQEVVFFHAQELMQWMAYNRICKKNELADKLKYQASTNRL